MDYNTPNREKQWQREGGLEGECTIINVAPREGFTGKDTFEQRPGGDGSYKDPW